MCSSSCPQFSDGLELSGIVVVMVIHKKVAISAALSASWVVNDVIESAAVRVLNPDKSFYMSQVCIDMCLGLCLGPCLDM